METLTRRGAELLAQRIEKYWRERGYPQVRAWVVEAVALYEETRLFGVLSNLDKFGNPPARAERIAA